MEQLWFDVDFLNLATLFNIKLYYPELWFDVDFLNLATKSLTNP